VNISQPKLRSEKLDDVDDDDDNNQGLNSYHVNMCFLPPQPIIGAGENHSSIAR